MTGYWLVTSAHTAVQYGLIVLAAFMYCGIVRDIKQEGPVMATFTSPDSRDHVQVWFGDFPIASYSAEPALAARYAGAMRRRPPTQRVTHKQITARQDPSTTVERPT